MTAPAASPAEDRMAQRFMTLGKMGGLLRDLDHARIAGELPPALAERLSAPRYRARLERRFMRRTGILDAADELLGSEAPQIAALGESGLRGVIVDVGVMCQYAALRRIVDQPVLSDLSVQVGLDIANHDARRATGGESIGLARAIAAPEPAQKGDTEATIHAILRDGLQCWSCWVHGRPPALSRFFDALMPALPRSGTDIACKPRECRRRAGLFDIRLKATLADRFQGDA